MRVSIFAMLLTSLGMVGCAHSLMRGSVAMKINETDGYICLGDKEVKAGDRVTFYKSSCEPPATGRTKAQADLCKMLELGKGTVTEILNDHYSIVKADPKVAFSEGTIVEKR